MGTPFSHHVHSCMTPCVLYTVNLNYAGRSFKALNLILYWLVYILFLPKLRHHGVLWSYLKKLVEQRISFHYCCDIRLRASSHMISLTEQDHGTAMCTPDCTWCAMIWWMWLVNQVKLFFVLSLNPTTISSVPEFEECRCILYNLRNTLQRSLFTIDKLMFVFQRCKNFSM